MKRSSMIRNNDIEKLLIVTAVVIILLSNNNPTIFISSAFVVNPLLSLLPLKKTKGRSTTTTTSSTSTAISSCRLSHVMIKVPSVQDTVNYWVKEHNGIIQRSSTFDENDNGDDNVNGKGNGGKLKGAFITLGDNIESSFALEITSLPYNSKFNVGNCFNYIGISMLVQYKNNLLGAITGEQKPTTNMPTEPNNIPIKAVASAPGDPLARISFKTKVPLEQVQTFYEDILQMKVCAIDDNMICLRYDNDKSSTSIGVPTTLVFETIKAGKDDDNAIDIGNCFDHLAIVTTFDIEQEYKRIVQQQENNNNYVKIFMKPIEMFGTKLFGIIDPNGYKIVLYN